MIWSVVQQIGGQVATLIVYFALAALLPPRDFGLVGMAGAWLAVLNTFCETGFGAALIQRDQVRGEHLSSTFAVNLAMGAALTLLGIVLSYPAARFFSTPDLQPVMAVLSLAFLMRAFGLTQVALAQRELRFRALAVRDVSANVLGGSAGLALALAGYGVWSLVGMTLVNGLDCDRHGLAAGALATTALRDLAGRGGRALALQLPDPGLQPVQGVRAERRSHDHRPVARRPCARCLFLCVQVRDLSGHDVRGCPGGLPLSPDRAAAVGRDAGEGHLPAPC